MFYQLILTVAVAGLIINMIALVIIGRKKHRTMFHDLLIILTVSDVAVVICCALQFALPTLWDAYSRQAYPHILQYLLPVMHITVMISVYTTILISFERYVRICFYCQLRETSILSEDNIKFYKCFVILFPLLFYIPKFFEVRSHREVVENQVEVDCQKYISLASILKNPFLRSYVVKELTPIELEKTEMLASACTNLTLNETIHDRKMSFGIPVEKRNMSQYRTRTNNETKIFEKTKSRYDAQKWTSRPIMDDTNQSVATQIKHRRRRKSEESKAHHYSKVFMRIKRKADINRTIEASEAKVNKTNHSAKPSRPEKSSLIRNITTSTKVSQRVLPTALRKNVYYYKIYYVYLNTFFASVLPLALLLFLNISTAIELIKMSRQETRVLARNTSVVIVPPRITMSECSEQRMSIAHSMTRSMDETRMDESIQPLTSDESCVSHTNGHQHTASNFNSARSSFCKPDPSRRRSTMTSDVNDIPDKNHLCSSPVNLQDRDHTQNNNLYNMVEVLELQEPHQHASAANSTVSECSFEPLTSPQTCCPKTGESRRNTITYDISESPGKSPTSNNDFDHNLTLSDIHETGSRQQTPTNPRNRIRRSFNRRRASSVFNRFVGRDRDSSRLSETTVVASGPSAREKKKELRLARISLCIVWLFIFCHTWKLIPTFYTTFISEDNNVGFDVVWPDWLTIIDRISHTFITLNSSLNFLIYVVV